MTKELKAFKKLREQNDFLKQRNIPKEYRYDDELDVIENALKDYEKQKQSVQTLQNNASISKTTARHGH